MLGDMGFSLSSLILSLSTSSVASLHAKYLFYQGRKVVESCLLPLSCLFSALWFRFRQGPFLS